MAAKRVSFFSSLMVVSGRAVCGYGIADRDADAFGAEIECE